jgi:hypothetical protein
MSLVVASGCHKIHHGVAGSGKRVTQKRDVSAFASINAQGAFNIEVVCQKPVSLEL